METEAIRLRIYLSNTDSCKHDPLYQILIRKARESGIAGATIYKGVMGYGTSSDLRPPSLWQFTEKVPVTIEIIDTNDRITSYLQTIRPLLEEQPKGCMITSETVKILFIKHGEN